MVIGGGDTTVEESTYLAKFGSVVYLVHRRDDIRFSKNYAGECSKTFQTKDCLGRSSRRYHGRRLFDHGQSEKHKD